MPQKKALGFTPSRVALACMEKTSFFSDFLRFGWDPFYPTYGITIGVFNPLNPPYQGDFIVKPVITYTLGHCYVNV